MAALTEKQFQQQVVDLFTAHGWRHYHTYDSRRSVAGFPDLVFAHKTRGVIFAELKSDTGRVAVAQQEWHDLLNSVSAVAFIWRPADFNAVEQIARKGAQQ